jgi:hypothetical protein
MILEAIFALAGVSAVASVINLFDKKKTINNTISLEKQMPGNLPIIALSNNNKMFNFILDSGSNISHICAEYYEDLQSVPIGTYKNGEVAGLGGKNIGITMCKAIFEDTLEHKYNIKLSISNGLSSVAKNIEDNTGVKIHGLLGTDFLREYKYTLDFRTLEVYPQK